MNQYGRRGFTLIELLVVIAIIAILAAILFPVFVRAKRSSQETTCIANQKQMAAAMLRYIDDNNNAFPYAGCNSYAPYAHSILPKPRGQGAAYVSCSEALLPYLSRNKKILFCPLWKGSHEERMWLSAGAVLDWSYWYFCGCKSTTPCAMYFPKATLCGYKMSDIRIPSKKPCLSEVNAPHAQDNTELETAVGQTQAYCDGHARLVRCSMKDLYKIGYIGRDGSPAPDF